MTEKTESTNPPEELIVAFQELELDSLISTETGYSAIADRLYAEADAMAKPSQRRSIIVLLAHCCSMYMTIESRNEPFRPRTVLQNSRSFALGDLAKNEVDLIAYVYSEVSNPMLRSRLADIVWILRKDFKAATAAIDAYCALTIEGETWNTNGRDCVERAGTLCLMLGTGVDDKLAKLKANVLAAFKTAHYPEDGYFSLQLAEVLLRFTHSEDDAEDICNYLEQVAISTIEDRDYEASRQYAELGAKWFSAQDNEQKKWALIELQARAWSGHANMQITDLNNPLAALGFYDQSIKLYRSIPRANRGEYVENEIVRLKEEYRNAGHLTADNLVPLSTTIDISDMVRAVVSDVSGKPLPDALFKMANLTRPKKREFRKSAEESADKQPISSLMSSTGMLSDGRVSGKKPGAMEDYEAHIWHKMLEQYSQEILIMTQGLIIPGLETFMNEHQLTVRDFVHIAQLSPIVPPDRHHIIGKGLHEGYQQDFASAISILIPQLENIIRYYLDKRGTETTTTTPEGTIHYVGMSNLVDKEPIEDIFGEDYVFEFKALFCDSQGSNLRNDLAHGIIDDDRYCSIEAVYAWHIIFKLIFNSYWIAARKQEMKKEISPSS